MNTPVTITLIIAATLLINSAIIAARDVAKAKHQTRQYPRADGDFTVLGPEIFTDRTGDVICWKGVNYTRQQEAS